MIFLGSIEGSYVELIGVSVYSGLTTAFEGLGGNFATFGFIN